MKKSGYKRRFYQDWYKEGGLYKHSVSYKETQVCVLADRQLEEGFIYEKIKRYRSQIEGYICKERRFLTSLKPLPVELNAAPIVKEMSLAAKKANVGPMASVAGAIAMFLVKDLARRKLRDVIVENGGDIYMITRSPRIIGIYSGKSRFWKGLKIKIYPDDTRDDTDNEQQQRDKNWRHKGDVDHHNR